MKSIKVNLTTDNGVTQLMDFLQYICHKQLSDICVEIQKKYVIITHGFYRIKVLNNKWLVFDNNIFHLYNDQTYKEEYNNKQESKNNMKEIKDYRNMLEDLDSISENPNFSDYMRSNAKSLGSYIKQYTIDIKPCPFCGGKAKAIMSEPDYDGTVEYYIECENEHSNNKWFYEKIDAIIEWNNRV